jgi:outer membrane protein assembly factor BamB
MIIGYSDRNIQYSYLLSFAGYMKAWASIAVLFLLIISTQGILQDAIASDDKEIENQSWSMYRGGPGRTGLSQYNTSFNQGGVKWTTHYEGGIASQSRSIAIAPDGTLYMGAFDPNGVIAFDKNGKEKWRYLIRQRNSIGSSSPSIGPDGTVYIGAGNDLIAINPDGNENWRYETDGIISSNPLISRNGTIYFGSADSNIYALDLNGTLLWNYSTQSELETSPSECPDGSIVITCYLGERSILALFPNGTVKWVIENDEFFRSSTIAVDDNGMIYLNGGRRNLYCISPNGRITWTFPTDHEIEMGLIVLCPAIGPDGTIYSGSINGLYAINPDGTQKWKSGPSDWTRTPTISADGIIYSRTIEGVTAFNPDGTERWVHHEEWAIVTELVIGDDGTIYYYNQNELIALNGEPVTLLDSKYPIYITLAISLVIIILMIIIMKKKRKGWYVIDRI